MPERIPDYMEEPKGISGKIPTRVSERTIETISEFLK